MRTFTSIKNYVLAVLMLWAGQAMAQTNLLQNESFEDWADGKPVHWVSITSASNATLEQSSDARTGVSSVLVKGASGNKRLASEEITLKAGTYVLSAYVKAATEEAATITLGYVPVVDGKVGTYVYGEYLNGATNADWQQWTFQFTLDEQTQVNLLVMNSKNPGKDVLVDDISLTTEDGGIAGGEDPGTPSVVVDDEVVFPSVSVGETSTTVLKVAGANLTSDLTVSVAGEGFSCSQSTIGKDEAAQTELNLAFVSQAEGEFTGTLTISGGGLETDKVVALKATCANITNDGTKEHPYNITEVIALNNPGTTAWVKGYIVGSVNGKNISDAVFGVENASNTNLLMAASVGETDVAKCVPVQLPSGSIRENLSLQTNPENIGKELMINASMVAYFGVPGLKEPSEYVLDGEEPAPVEKTTYKKATSIESGKTYILAAEVDGEFKVAQNLSSNFGYLYVVSAKAENEQIELTSDNNGFIFTETDGGYTIVDMQNRYMYMKDNYNNFNVSAEPQDGMVWTVEANVDGTFKITNVNKDKYIQFSVNHNSYGSYADEQGIMPQLYVKVEEGGDAISEIMPNVEDGAIEVYTINGVKVGTSLEGLKNGIYIVKQGNVVKKIIK